MPRCPLPRIPAASIGPATCLAAIALLSACSNGPQISAQQESTQYLTRARRSYTPPGSASDPWGPYINEAAAKYDVPDRWIREVMHQESGGNLYGRSGDLITSGAGAMGLMQVMPGTYDELRARYAELGSDPFDPHNNILAGTAYIREMYDIYGSPGFLAAYNAGPGRLDDYLTRSRTLPEETRRYVANIGPRIAGSFPSTRSPGEQYAMNSLPMQISAGPRYAAGVNLAAQQPYSPAVAIALNQAPVAAQAERVATLPERPQAEPQSGYIKLSPQAEPQGDYIKLSPQPVEVAQLPETPADLPAPSAFRPMPAAQPLEPQRVSPQHVLPTPPRYQAAEATRQFAALTPVSPPRSSGFSLVSQANAAPVAMHHGGSTLGSWAVQVGAFETAHLATAATSAARDTARDVLGQARPAVTTVRQSRGKLYRARLVGLSHDAAAHACERLVRTRTSCMIVSPEAQS